jgi:hypothetical protein
MGPTVDHVARRQPKALRDLGLSRLAAAELGAHRTELRSRGAVDGAVDAAATEQALTGGVDDGVDVERGYVTLDDLDALRHRLLDAWSTRGSSRESAL